MNIHETIISVHIHMSTHKHTPLHVQIYIYRHTNEIPHTHITNLPILLQLHVCLGISISHLSLFVQIPYEMSARINNRTSDERESRAAHFKNWDRHAFVWLIYCCLRNVSPNRHALVWLLSYRLSNVRSPNRHVDVWLTSCCLSNVKSPNRHVHVTDTLQFK